MFNLTFLILCAIKFFFILVFFLKKVKIKTFSLFFIFVIIETMIITYLGKQFFKVTQGDLVVAFNPVSKNSKTGVSAKFGADIALITTNHPDFNGVDQLTHGDRVPFIINGPGDYEVKDLFIKGAMSETKISDKDYINTIYSIIVDGINLVFLGSLSDGDISKEVRESVGIPDILFVPVGENTLDAKTASKLALSLEAKMVIPMDYETNTLKSFLKEIGEEDVKAIDKLTIKRKDLEGKEAEVVVLEC